ncbi:MAG: radical SAM protein [Thermodesulfovibrionales bacterium]
MGCTETAWLTDTEYLKQFSDRAYQLRIPLSGGIELTSRCNLRCVHCYYGPHTDESQTIKNEMDTGKILSVIDEITEAGCLYLLITGGEPLIRKDFSEIYRYIKTKGLLITVFTNGTLISDDIAGLFQELPPQAVEITLYGASDDTCDRITGVQGSLRKCLTGIQKLLDHKVRVKLKTILMTLNSHEFSAMEDIAKAFGVPFRFDAALFPRFSGDKTPIRLRVSPEAAVEEELSDDQRLKDYCNFFKRTRDFPVYDTLYICSAGHTNFHIDSYGNLKPCLMINNIKYELSSGSFESGWHDVIRDIISQKVPENYTCNTCEKRSLCGFCPAFFQLENDSEYIRSEYLCTMGKQRYKIINDYEGGDNEKPRR